MTLELDAQDLATMFPDDVAPTPPDAWEGAWVDALDQLAGIGYLVTLTTRAGERRYIIEARHGRRYAADAPVAVRLDCCGRVIAMAEWPA